MERIFEIISPKIDAFSSGSDKSINTYPTKNSIKTPTVVKRTANATLTKMFPSYRTEAITARKSIFTQIITAVDNTCISTIHCHIANKIIGTA